MKRFLKTMAAICAASLLLLAGCSDGSDDDDDTPATSSTTTSQSTTTTTTSQSTTTTSNFIALQYAKRANNIDGDESWTTWNENAQYVEVSQTTTDTGYAVTVTYDSSKMNGNVSSDDSMKKYGTAKWAVTTTDFTDGADGIMVVYNETEYSLNDFFFGGAEEVSDNAYHDWWLLKAGDDASDDTAKAYDRNGKSTTLTFKQSGKDDTVVTISFVDTATTGE